MTRRYQVGEKITFTVAHDLSPRLFLPYLASRLAIKISRAERLLVLHAVKLNNTFITLDTVTPLKKNSLIEVVIPENWLPHLAATEIPLNFLYEDEFFLALDKPAGIVAHPARGHLHGRTLQNGVLHYYRADLNPEKVIAPPHRLDRDTSGVLLFSRTQLSYRRLCALMATRQVEKKYLALVEGVAAKDEFTIDAPLGAHPEIYGIGAVIAEKQGGKKAVTEFTVLKRGAGWTFLEARPRTGRGHQIRLHLQHGGLPLIGDRDYNLHSRFTFSRQALHAATLTFIHPFTQQSLTITAPLPPEFSAFIE